MGFSAVGSLFSDSLLACYTSRVQKDILERERSILGDATFPLLLRLIGLLALLFIWK